MSRPERAAPPLPDPWAPEPPPRPGSTPRFPSPLWGEVPRRRKGDPFGPPVAPPSLRLPAAALVCVGAGLILAVIPVTALFAGVPILVGGITALVALFRLRHGGRGVGLCVTALVLAGLGWPLWLILARIAFASG